MLQKGGIKLSSIISAVLIGCFLTVSSGCSVVMALRQPNYRNMNVLEMGTPRSVVVAELGAPVLTEEKDGKKKDLFSFRQGYGTGNKVCRALFHAAADFFTLFLWEVIGTPTEAIVSGRNVKVEVFYDENEKVEKINTIDDKNKSPKK